jgi:hypothetical protein
MRRDEERRTATGPGREHRPVRSPGAGRVDVWMLRIQPAGDRRLPCAVRGVVRRRTSVRGAEVSAINHRK